MSPADQYKIHDAYYRSYGLTPEENYFQGDKYDAARLWVMQLAPSNRKRIDVKNPNAVIRGADDQAKVISDKDARGNRTGRGVLVGSAMGGTIKTAGKFGDWQSLVGTRGHPRDPYDPRQNFSGTPGGPIKGLVGDYVSGMYS